MESSMHISAHRLIIPPLTTSSLAPKANSEPTEFAEMAGIAEDLTIDGKPRSPMRRPSQRRSRDARTEGADSHDAANRHSFIAASSPALRASFDLTLLAAPNSASGGASLEEADGRAKQNLPTIEPSLDDLLTLVRTAG
jgi:hypothetical protein